MEKANENVNTRITLVVDLTWFYTTDKTKESEVTQHKLENTGYRNFFNTKMLQNGLINQSFQIILQHSKKA